MYTKHAIHSLSESIEPIILKKFNTYFEDRQNDVSLLPKIDVIVNHIEELEDTIAEMTNDLSFKNGDYITLDGYSFSYTTETGDFIYSGDKLHNAKYNVLSKEKLSYDWKAKDLIKKRITSILNTIDEVNTDFDTILKLVENQIDFNEMINLQ